MAKYSQGPPLQGSSQPVSQARKWFEHLGELHKTTLPGTVAGDTAWRKFNIEFERACGRPMNIPGSGEGIYNFSDGSTLTANLSASGHLDMDFTDV